MSQTLLPGLDVSRETLDQLRQYADLIRKWTPKINLVAPSSLPRLWERHILDSAQLLSVSGPAPANWADLGSGAGLPGIVIAILSPKSHLTLIESDQRKSTFLRTCAREIGLDITVLAERAEAVAPLQAGIVTARALAPLDSLLSLVVRHLATDGLALLPKGKSAQTEIEQARRNWRFDVRSYPSYTDPDAAVLCLQRISRA